MPSIPSNEVSRTVKELLAAESPFDGKHDDLAGVPHAIAGASTCHHGNAANFAGALSHPLRGQPGRVFGSDQTIRLKTSRGTCFCYPDVTIVRSPAGLGASSWKDEPRVIFEILSGSTRAIGDREKRIAGPSTPGWDASVLLEPDTMRALSERRSGDGWQREVPEGPDALLSLPSVEVEGPLAEICENLDL